MSYNLTLLRNVTNPEIVVTTINDFTNGTFGVLLLVTIFVLVYTIWSRQGLTIEENLTFSSFVTAVLGGLLWGLGLLTWEIAIIPLVVAFATFIIKQFRG